MPSVVGPLPHRHSLGTFRPRVGPQVAAPSQGWSLGRSRCVPLSRHVKYSVRGPPGQDFPNPKDYRRASPHAYICSEASGDRSGPRYCPIVRNNCSGSGQDVLGYGRNVVTRPHGGGGNPVVMWSACMVLTRRVEGARGHRDDTLARSAAVKHGERHALPVGRAAQRRLHMQGWPGSELARGDVRVEPDLQ